MRPELCNFGFFSFESSSNSLYLFFLYEDILIKVTLHLTSHDKNKVQLVKLKPKSLAGVNFTDSYVMFKKPAAVFYRV